MRNSRCLIDGTVSCLQPQATDSVNILRHFSLFSNFSPSRSVSGSAALRKPADSGMHSANHRPQEISQSEASSLWRHHVSVGCRVMETVACVKCRRCARQAGSRRRFHWDKAGSDVIRVQKKQHRFPKRVLIFHYGCFIFGNTGNGDRLDGCLRKPVLGADFDGE